METKLALITNSLKKQYVKFYIGNVFYKEIPRDKKPKLYVSYVFIMNDKQGCDELIKTLSI